MKRKLVLILVCMFALVLYACGSEKVLSEEEYSEKLVAAEFLVVMENHEEAILALEELSGSEYATDELYTKLANEYFAIGEYEKAVEVLNSAAEQFESESIAQMISDLKYKKAGIEALKNIPYYGDITKCKMDAYVSYKYASLLYDGMRGNYGSDMWEMPQIWNEKSYIPGYDGNLYVDRATVLLADLYGDGYPYLFVCDSDDMYSFSIFGWDEEKVGGLLSDPVELLYHYDEGESRAGVDFYEADGHVVLEYSGAESATEHFRTIYGFGAYQMHEIDPSSIEEYKWAETFAEACDNRCTLREMIGYLNNYTSSTMGDTLGEVAAKYAEQGSFPDVVVIREESVEQKIAKEMLSRINQCENLNYAKVIDMNQDGKDELILHWQTPGDPYGTFVSIFNEVNGELHETQLDLMGTTPRLFFDGEEYFITVDGSAGSSFDMKYCYVDAVETLYSDGNETYLHNGSSVDSTTFMDIWNRYDDYKQIEIIEYISEEQIDDAVYELRREL